MATTEERLARRLSWIEACVRYAGSFGGHEKKSYAALFSVSPATVTSDQAEFCRRFNAAVGRLAVEVTRGKVEARVGGAHLPEAAVLPSVPALRDWLADLSRRDFHRVGRLDRREPRPEVVRVVLRGILDRSRVTVRYVSRSSGESHKTISPHSLVDVVGRLHARAFDHEKNRFADFVLSRVRGASFPARARDGYVGDERDRDWHAAAWVVVEAKPGQGEAALQAVALDFGLEGGRRRVKTRKALVRYITTDLTLAGGDGFDEPVTVREE